MFDLLVLVGIDLARQQTQRDGYTWPLTDWYDACTPDLPLMHAIDAEVRVGADR